MKYTLTCLRLRSTLFESLLAHEEYFDLKHNSNKRSDKVTNYRSLRNFDAYCIDEFDIQRNVHRDIFLK
jgi:hypothetical protein